MEKRSSFNSLLDDLLGWTKITNAAMPNPGFQVEVAAKALSSPSNKNR